MADTGFDEKLGVVLTKQVAGCKALLRADRLSGGASQETYRLLIDSDEGEKLLCLRRAPGGVTSDGTLGDNPGLAVEALLMQTARAAGVPEPQVHYVLQPADDLGDGFVMEWLEGEAVWNWRDSAAGRWSIPLLKEALARNPAVKPGRMEDNVAEPVARHFLARLYLAKPIKQELCGVTHPPCL